LSTPRIRFDRNELAGSFGDIGTDLRLGVIFDRFGFALPAIQQPTLNDILTGFVVLALPQGFLVGLVLGTIVYYGFRRFGRPAKEIAP